MRIRVGSRPSPLARKQVDEIFSKLPGVDPEIVTIYTSGDKDKKTPLINMENSDFFTREIEDALMRGEIDAAVHSAKDLEDELPDALVIAARTKSISPADCIVSKEGYTLESIPERSIIGTSSKARTEGVKRYREDLVVKDIRGNINERLDQLDKGAYDAVIVAQAALIRLGYWDRPARVIPDTVFAPHPLQGKLAVQVSGEREDLLKIFRGINEE